MMYLNGTVDIKDILKKNLNRLENSSLILKFIRTLEVPVEFEDELVLKCAAEGSIADLLAAAVGFIDEKGTICGYELDYYLSCIFSSTSVHLTAILHSNQIIIEFLIKKCTNIIQQLPFEHQVLISTTTFNTNKIGVLCDLLEVADFPFPENMNSKSIIEDLNLQRIIDERTKFHECIITEKNSEIKKFVENHPKLKYAYNLENKSALGNALDSKQYESFYFLKSLRFCDYQIENFDDGSCDDDDKKKADRIASKQRKKNVKISKPNELNTVLILATRSLIYHRNKKNNAEDVQRKKIKEWFKDIYETEYGSKLLNAAVQCQELKIIFDFECKSVSQ
jgi:hypothetical protein